MNQLSPFGPQQNGCCLLVEDQETTRDYLETTLMAAFPDVTPITVRNLREARSWLDQRSGLTDELPLKLALVDLGLPDGCGIDIVRHLAQSNPEVPSMIITIYDDDAHVFGALAAGAYGYILKDEDPAFLIDLLRRMQRGEPPLSPSIAHRLIAHFRGPSHRSSNDVALTSREQETLSLIARGYTVAEAAGKMSLSAQTVAGYVKIIYQKLHISNRAEATREAMRRGLA